VFGVSLFDLAHERRSPGAMAALGTLKIFSMRDDVVQSRAEFGARRGAAADCFTIVPSFVHQSARVQSRLISVSAVLQSQFHRENFCSYYT
jgi:hypothetical protein